MAWLTDRLKEASAQINPFDRGATAATVRKKRREDQPARTISRKQSTNTITNNPVTRGLSRGFDQVNFLDNGRTWQQRTPTQNKNLVQQAGQFGGQTARALVGGTAKFANTGNLAARQAVEGARMATGLATGNSSAAVSASNRADQNYDRFARQGSGLLGTGTVFKSPEEAKRGDFSTTAKRVGGGTIATAAEIVPAARGASFVRRGMKAKQAIPRLLGENTIYSGAASVGSQLMENGRVDAGQLAKDTALGNAAGLVTFGAGRGIAKAAPAVQRGIQKTAQSARQIDERMFTPRANLDDQAALRDYSDYLVGANPARGQELNDTIVNARAAAQRQGLDIVNGSRADQLEKVNSVLDQIGQRNRTVGQGGYVQIPGRNPAIDRKQRGFVTSVKNSDEVSPTTSRQTSGMYDVRDTNKLQSEAEAFAANDPAIARKSLDERLNVKDGKITDREVADTIAFAKRLDSEGDFEGATGLYDRLAEHLTKLGQSVQAASLLSRRTPDGILYQAQKSLGKAGVKLMPDKQVELKQLIDNVRQTLPDSPERQRATYDVTRFVNANVPNGTADRIINLWRAGLLTAPTTTAGNILGNASEAAIRKSFVNPVATAADAAIGLFTGKRTQALAPLGSGLEGAKIGASKLPDFIRTGYDERNALSKYDAQEVSYGDSPAGKLANAYVNGVYRLMGTADQPFYYSAQRNALGSIAKAEAVNRGLKGEAASTFVDEFLANPPKAAAERATQEAAYATFQNKTGLGSVAQGLKRAINSAVPGLGDFIVPFTQVPASIATRIITRTPLGAAAEAVKQFKTVKEGGQFDQRALAQAIGEGSFGAAVLGVGYAMANSGLMTFGYPEDQRERKLWEAEGKQPYSIKIGDRWYSLNYIQPFGTQLAIGAKAGEEIEAGKSLPEALAAAAGTAGQSLSNQSFIKGLSGAIEAVSNPSEKFTQYLNQTGGSIVPNIIGATTRAFDPLQREQAGFVEGIKQDIPGLRDDTPAKTDAFGQPLGAKDNPANQLLNPLRPSIARDDNVVAAEARRLQDNELGALPSQINKTSLGKDTELSKDQIRDLQNRVGKTVNDAWEQLVNDDRYKSLSDEDRQKALKSLSSDILTVEKRKYAAEKQLGEYSPEFKGKNTKLTAKQNAILNGNLDVSTYAKGNGSKNDTVIKGDDRGTALLDKVGTLDKQQRKEWEESDFDGNYQDLYDRASQIRYKDLPDLPKNNRVLGMYADLLKKRENGMSKLSENKAKLKFLKEAYKTSLSKDDQEILSASATDILEGIDQGFITAEQVKRVAEYDNMLVSNGLSSTADIPKSVRTALGLGSAPSRKGSSGTSGGGRKTAPEYNLLAYTNPAANNKSLRELINRAQINR